MDGSWEQHGASNTCYRPAPARRKRADGLGALDDETLAVLEEVYGALDADHRIVAAIGAGTLLDRAMTLLALRPKAFPGKLKELWEKGRATVAKTLRQGKAEPRFGRLAGGRKL